jgi:hypothetical protein
MTQNEKTAAIHVWNIIKNILQERLHDALFYHFPLKRKMSAIIFIGDIIFMMPGHDILAPLIKSISKYNILCERRDSYPFSIVC